LRICLLLCIIGTGFADSANDLRPDFYKSQCPQALEAIKAEITSAVRKEPAMGLVFFRLHFIDCVVQGCDASNLLKDTANFTGEQSAIPSLDSRNGTDIIEKIKARVEKLCPGVVSCADIVAFAARDSVVANLLKKKGLLHTDQELYNGGSTDSIVEFYATNPLKFIRYFVKAVIKMGN
ncbi:Cationic peroxidase 1, partial [Glycine soja]